MTTYLACATARALVTFGVKFGFFFTGILSTEGDIPRSLMVTFVLAAGTVWSDTAPERTAVVVEFVLEEVGKAAAWAAPSRPAAIAIFMAAVEMSYHSRLMRAEA